MKELIEKRGPREKYFLKEDGEFLVKVYDEDIHFQTNSTFEEIDNTLIEEKNYITNRKNAYKVTFPKEQTKELFQIKSSGHLLKVSLKDQHKLSKQCSKICHHPKKMIYHNICNDIDLEYSVKANKLKESILLKTKEAEKETLDFSIITDLYLEVKESGNIQAKKEEIIYFEIEKPYMIDQNGIRNDKIFYTLEKEQEEYLLTLHLDTAWLQEKERAYPVMIDPTIINHTTKESVEDTYIYEGDTNVDRNSKDYFKVGVEKEQDKNIVNRALIKFQLPKLETGCQITNARLSLIGYPVVPRNDETEVITIHQVTIPWEETTATWNKMHNQYNPRIEGTLESNHSTIINGELSYFPCEAELTNLVKKWYSYLPNNGILLKTHKEEYCSEVVPTFFSKNNEVQGDSPKPILIITYRNQNGLENYMDYETQSYTKGTIYQNKYNGNLTNVLSLGNTLGKKFPINLSLIYNSNDVLLQKNIGYGLGYQCNFDQSIKKTRIEEIPYLEYHDEDGTIHYFYETEGKYQDEDGLGYTIEESDTEFQLLDKVGNKKRFHKVGEIAYLTGITNTRGYSITLTRDTSQRITKIEDGDQETISISYTEEKIVVTTLSETITLQYEEGKLIKRIGTTGTISFTYNENQLLKSITDETGKTFEYQYYEIAPYRVWKVQEYGITNTLGNHLEFQYGFDTTTIIDTLGRATTTTYDSQGTICSITNLKAKEDIKDAYGIDYSYGTSDSNKHKLNEVGMPLQYIKNYFKNTSFETTNHITYENTTEKSFFGLSSLKIHTTAENQYITKEFQVPKGKFYTLSSYFQNEIPLYMILSYQSEDGAIIKAEEIIPVNTSFERYDVTIDYPNTARTNLTMTIMPKDIGNIYLDAIQLEEGEVANLYNHIQNSSFEDGIEDWTYEVKETNTGIILPRKEGEFERVTLENGINALKVTMDSLRSTSFQKVFPIQGKGGDLYTLTFWYKNEGLVAYMGYDAPVSNNCIIKFHYKDQEYGHGLWPSLPFVPNDTEWQYFKVQYKAEYDFDYIEIIFFQEHNANSMYLTNFNFVKDVNSIAYNYDEYGNLKKTTGLNKEINQFTYDKNNQLIKMTNPKGKQSRLEYDNNVTNRILRSISPTGITNEIKYDTFGNPIVTRTKKNQKNTLTTGLYHIRAKGTNEYLRLSGNQLLLKEEICAQDVWKLTQKEGAFIISHAILNNRYLSNAQDTLQITYFSPTTSFDISKQENGSYHIQLKDQNLYWKTSNNSIILTSLIENDPTFEFYFEDSTAEEFIENNATYTEDGKFIKTIKDTLLHTTIYDINPITGLTNAITNPKKQTTIYTYNDKHQLTKVRQKDNEIHYTYNPQNILSKIEDSNKEYHFLYDDFLNTKQIKINNQPLITNTYQEHNGNLTTSTYGNNHTIHFTYDDFDRLSKVTKMDDVYQYKYGSNGDLIKILSNDVITKYTYDTAKRLQEYRIDDVKVNYTYDINNLLIRKTYKDKKKEYTLETTYNEEDQPTITTFDNQAINYTYDSLGRLTSKTINNQTPTTYKYVSNGKRTSTLLKQLNNNEDTYDYKYDELNNITHIYHNNHLEMRYHYDEYNELIREDNYKRNETIRYKYDKAGNIQYKEYFPLNQYNQLHQNTYEYNNPNWKDQLTKYNNQTITYDTLGNPITIGDTTLTWINGRQLQKYQDQNNTITYKYNQDSIRTKKTINNIETTYFLEGSDIILEKRGEDVLYYMRNALEGVIGFNYNNDTYYYIKNAQRDILGILDSNYNQVATYEYDSWGNILSIKDNNGNDVTNDMAHIGNINPFRYRSYYYDTETRLYYLNSRYYNPEWGRFLNADGIIGANKDILGYNLFAYTSNDFINKVDSNGNLAISTILGMTLGAFLGMHVGTRAVALYASDLYSKKLPLASAMLNKSLLGIPGNVDDSIKNMLGKKLIHSEELEEILDNVDAEENACQILRGSKAFDSDQDLHLAINKANYVVMATKISYSTWSIKIRLYDKYDFDREDQYNNFFVSTINNGAYVYQTLGFLSQYDWDVTYDFIYHR